MRILVIGITGMLGNAVFRRFAREPDIEVFGTVRDGRGRRHFDAHLHDRIIAGVDANAFDSVVDVVARARPDVVVNAVGLIKQLDASHDPLRVLPINAMFPHRLARLAQAASARLVHVSTDCVFNGSRGGYLESDLPDAVDLYGRSKLIGEVDYPNAITLRTSIIGREIESRVALVDWFLSQPGPSTKGYTRAVFSGLPTIELSEVILQRVLPNPGLHGLYHVAAAPIAKRDLLQLVADAYGKSILLEPDDSVVIDRSLDATRFNQATGYVPPTWPALIEKMKEFG